MMSTATGQEAGAAESAEGKSAPSGATAVRDLFSFKVRLVLKSLMGGPAACANSPNTSSQSTTAGSTVSVGTRYRTLLAPAPAPTIAGRVWVVCWSALPQQPHTMSEVTPQDVTFWLQALGPPCAYTGGADTMRRIAHDLGTLAQLEACRQSRLESHCLHLSIVPSYDPVGVHPDAGTDASASALPLCGAKKAHESKSDRGKETADSDAGPNPDATDDAKDEKRSDRCADDECDDDGERASGDHKSEIKSDADAGGPCAKKQEMCENKRDAGEQTAAIEPRPVLRRQTAPWIMSAGDVGNMLYTLAPGATLPFYQSDHLLGQVACAPIMRPYSRPSAYLDRGMTHDAPAFLWTQRDPCGRLLHQQPDLLAASDWDSVRAQGQLAGTDAAEAQGRAPLGSYSHSTDVGRRCAKNRTKSTLGSLLATFTAVLFFVLLLRMLSRPKKRT